VALELIEEPRVEIAHARHYSRGGAQPEIRTKERARATRECNASDVTLADIQSERVHLPFEHIFQPRRADREELEPLGARRRLGRRTARSAALRSCALGALPTATPLAIATPTTTSAAAMAVRARSALLRPPAPNVAFTLLPFSSANRGRRSLRTTSALRPGVCRHAV